MAARISRHSCADHLLEAGANIREIKKLKGHKNIKTTQIYLHCMTRPNEKVISPLDQM